MLLIIPIIYGVVAAAGATIGAIATYAAGETDRSKAKYHKNVANRLTVEHKKLTKKFIDLASKSEKEIKALQEQAVQSETEKDLLRVCVLMQQELIKLMVNIDQSPDYQTVAKLQEAVISTNMILEQLQLSTVPIPSDYFQRNYQKAFLPETNAGERQELEASISGKQQRNEDQAELNEYFDEISNLVAKLNDSKSETNKKIIFRNIGRNVLNAIKNVEANEVNKLLDFLREAGVGINHSSQGDSLFEGYVFSNKVRFTSLDFSDFNLSGLYLAKLNLSNGKFVNADFSESILSGGNLSMSDFSGANFSGADLTKTVMNGTNFSGVDLQKQNLSGISSTKGNFSGADLSDANLSRSFFDECSFSGANLTGVDLSHTRMYLSNCYNVFIDQDTIIPETIKQSCVVYEPIILS